MGSTEPPNPSPTDPPLPHRSTPEHDPKTNDNYKHKRENGDWNGINSHPPWPSYNNILLGLLLILYSHDFIAIYYPIM